MHHQGHFSEHNYKTDNNRTKKYNIEYINTIFVVRGLQCEKLVTAPGMPYVIVVSQTDTIWVKQHVEHMKVVRRGFTLTVRDNNDQLQVFNSCWI